MMVLSIFSLSTLVGFFTWRTLAIVLALLNLKSLPLIWHVRLIYHLCRHWKQRSQVKQIIRDHEGPEHPLFAPVTIWSSCPLAEIDLFLHKNNGTYFSDLDIARTAIVARTFGAGYRTGFKALEKEGKRGQLKPILGSVHCSFKKEIKPYQRYKIVSRILGWDKKWLIIASWFILPAKGDNTPELCVSCLSKYVFKKGRYTVTPEMALQMSGWLPSRTTIDQESLAPTHPLHRGGCQGADMSSQGCSKTTSGPISKIQPKGILKHRRGGSWNTDLPESVGSATGTSIITSVPPDSRIEQSEQAPVLSGRANVDVHSSTSIPLANDEMKIKGRNWDWGRVDRERQFGVKVAQGWLDLDHLLREEYWRFEDGDQLASLDS